MTTLQASRYTAGTAPEAATGWTVARVTEPSRLFGANGVRTGPDGRLYIAQVTGMVCRWDPPLSAVQAIRIEVLRDFLARHMP